MTDSLEGHAHLHDRGADEPDARADEPDAHTHHPETRADAPDTQADEPTAPRSRRALLLFGAVATVVVVAFVAMSTGILRLVPSPDMPPAGVVWFGGTYDPDTLVLDRTWTSSPVGQPVSVVAHLSRPSTPGLAVTMTLDGSPVVNTKIQIGTGHDYVAFAPGVALGHVAGTWVVTIADGQGVLATGTLTVTP